MLAKDKFSELNSSIRLALVSTTLRDPDRRFLRDMQKKLEAEKRQIRFTAAQRSRLQGLLSKHAHHREGSQILEALKGQVHNPRSRTWTKRARRRVGLTTWLWRAVLVLLAIGFLGFKAIERFPEYIPVSVLSAVSARVITGPVPHVRDGDTIEVVDGQKRIPIRFGSLDCAERGTAAGGRATQRMQELVNRRTLTCYLNGRASYDRKIGSCRLEDGRDLGSIMISEGVCGRYW